LHQLLFPPRPYPPPPPCTFLAHVLPCLSIPLNLFSTHRSHAFWLPSTHWNSCSKGSGPVFRAGFLAAGPPQCPLHAFTTTCLTLLPSLFCVQGSASNSSTPPFWVALGKHQKKVRNAFISPCCHCPHLAPMHRYCFPPLSVTFPRTKRSAFLVCTPTHPFRNRFFWGQSGFSAFPFGVKGSVFCDRFPSIPLTSPTHVLA
jgi:hypothetical protein